MQNSRAKPFNAKNRPFGPGERMQNSRAKPFNAKNRPFGPGNGSKTAERKHQKGSVESHAPILYGSFFVPAFLPG